MLLVQLNKKKRRGKKFTKKQQYVLCIVVGVVAVCPLLFLSFPLP